MRFVLTSAALGTLLSLATTDARAERPLEDKKAAVAVVVGTVQKITPTESKFGDDGVMTSYAAEIKVDKVDKGNDLKPGDTVTIHWFDVTKRPSKPFPAAYGHKYAVKAKETVRVYLVQPAKNNNFTVIYNPAGIEKADKTDK